MTSRKVLRRKTAAEIKAENLARRRSLIEVMRQYARSFERREACVPAGIEVKLLNGRTFDTGRVLVKDISLMGALLTKIRLKKGVLPAKPFRLHLSFTGSKHTGIHATCIPIRFGKGPEFEIGVEFESLWVEM